jgi:hypothetical protein
VRPLADEMTRYLHGAWAFTQLLVPGQSLGTGGRKEGEEAINHADA